MANTAQPDSPLSQELLTRQMRGAPGGATGFPFGPVTNSASPFDGGTQNTAMAPDTAIPPQQAPAYQPTTPNQGQTAAPMPSPATPNVTAPTMPTARPVSPQLLKGAGPGIVAENVRLLMNQGLSQAQATQRAMQYARQGR